MLFKAYGSAVYGVEGITIAVEVNVKYPFNYLTLK